MSHLNRAALLAASTALASRPRAVFAAPRADAGGNDPAKILADLKASFEAFKTENDKRLNGKADVVTDEKVERINADVTKLQEALDAVAVRLAAAQAGAGQQEPMSAEEQQYTRQFNAWCRAGDHEGEIRAANRTGIRAALSVGSAGDGGYTAPIEWDREITGRLKIVSVMRQYADVKQVSGPGYTHLYSDRAVGSGWVGETAARPATSTPSLAPLSFQPGTLYAFPFATQDILDDSQINIETWLGDEVETEFGRQEGIAFNSGDGVNKPYGLFTYAVGAANAARHPWGAIPTLKSGAAAALTADGILSLIYDLPNELSANANLFMNRSTIGGARKLKDGQGNYLWQPSFQAGQPATLASVPVVTLSTMDPVAAGNIAMAYGDMEATYVVVDRIGIRVLRDAISNKPYVGFYTTKRVGGGVKNPEPMRFLQIGA